MSVRLCIGECIHLKQCYLGYLMVFCAEKIKSRLYSLFFNDAQRYRILKILNECYSEIAVGPNKNAKIIVGAQANKNKDFVSNC